MIGSLLVIVLTGVLTSGSTTGKTALAAGETPSVQAETLQVEQVAVDANECRVSNKYPEKIRRWCDLIQKYAEKNGLPPDLVAALIWQESGGNPQAYSRSGAVGLMQIMARDGKSASFMCINGPCFSKRPTIEQLNDPEFNVKYGTRMLAGLNNRLGSIRDALKSYGPMDVGYSYADKVLGIYDRYRE